MTTTPLDAAKAAVDQAGIALIEARTRLASAKVAYNAALVELQRLKRESVGATATELPSMPVASTPSPVLAKSPKLPKPAKPPKAKR